MGEALQSRKERRCQAVCRSSKDQRRRQEAESTEDPALSDPADVLAEAYFPEPDAQEDGGGQEAQRRLSNALVGVPSGAEGATGCRGCQEEEREKGEAVSAVDKSIASCATFELTSGATVSTSK